MSGNGRLTRSTTRRNINISMEYGCTIDTNVYCYRLINGKQVFVGVKLGRGWENQPFDVTKLSCYEEKKGEDNVAKGRIAKEKPSDEELRIFAEKHNHSNLVKRVKNEYHVGEPTARRWLMEAGLIQPRQAKEAEQERKDCEGCTHIHDMSEYCLKNCQNFSGYQAQTPPEPEQAANQELDQSETPAPDIVPENEITVKDVLMYELEHDYNEPQRKTFTSFQYNEMVNNDDRRDALGVYCENQAVESLLKRWAGEVFEHSGLSAERKLKLIGQLLDLGVGA